MKKYILCLFLLTLLTLSFGNEAFARNIANNVKLSSVFAFNKTTFESYLKNQLDSQKDKSIKISSGIKKEYKTGDTFVAKWRNSSKNKVVVVGLLNVKGDDKYLETEYSSFEVEDNEFVLEITNDMPSGDYLFLVAAQNQENSNEYYNYSKTFKVKTITPEAEDNKFTSLIGGGDSYNLGKLTQDEKEELVYELVDNLTAISESYYYLNNSKYSGFCTKEEEKFGLKELIKDFKSAGAKKINCDAGSNAWAFEFKLKNNDDYFCVDSVGRAIFTSKSKGKKATGCDGSIEKKGTKVSVKENKTEDIPEFRENFIIGCTNNDQKMNDFCNCAYDKLLDKYGIVNFVQISLQYYKTNELDSEVTQTTLSCLDKY